MATTVRAGETRSVVFTVGGASAVNLTTSTLVELLRISNSGVKDSTDDDTGLLTVTDAANGVVTLAPNAAWWDDGVSWYDVCIEVTIGGVVTTYPSTTNLRFNVVNKLD